MRWEELDREPCSLARSLSIVGDRWTLLVLRECFLRVRRFEEFEQRLGIARHVLADRLKKLTDAGVLTKVPYQERPRREEYRLTEKGLDLYPVMLSLLDWGDKWMSGAEGPPASPTSFAVAVSMRVSSSLMKVLRSSPAGIGSRNSRTMVPGLRANPRRAQNRPEFTAAGTHSTPSWR